MTPPRSSVPIEELLPLAEAAAGALAPRLDPGAPPVVTALEPVDSLAGLVPPSGTVVARLTAGLSGLLVLAGPPGEWASEPALADVAAALAPFADAPVTIRAADAPGAETVVGSGPWAVAQLGVGDEAVALVAVRLDTPADPPPAAFPAFGAQAPGTSSRHSLDLLSDVEMEVTAELGRTRMQVRDLLALVPGTVVELDRAAGSPVDVLVNGTLIARGEVVVIDEEYGVRITEIVSEREE